MGRGGIQGRIWRESGLPGGWWPAGTGCRGVNTFANPIVFLMGNWLQEHLFRAFRLKEQSDKIVSLFRIAGDDEK